MTIIEICGIDGSGKTTLIHKLRRKINDATQFVAYERNFKNKGKRLLEHIAQSNGHKRAEEYFNVENIEFSNAVDMVQEVNSSFYFLNDNSTQIYFVDKYYTSWLAEVIVKKVDGVDKISQILNYLPKPKLSIYLDVTTSDAITRLESRTKGDQILSTKCPTNQLENLRVAFVESMNLTNLNYKIIDSTEGFEVVYEKALDYLIEEGVLPCGIKN
ncbi:hypothetical protein PDK32_27540 [Bacillus cereus]|nr:hypothetical protein [Bacillus cereus]